MAKIVDNIMVNPYTTNSGLNKQEALGKAPKKLGSNSLAKTRYSSSKPSVESKKFRKTSNLERYR